MQLLGLLIVFPMLVALVLLLVKNDSARAGIVYVGAAVTAVASIVAVALNIGNVEYFTLDGTVINWICIIAGVAVAAVILKFAITYRNIPAMVLVVIQLAGTLVFELGFAHGFEVSEGICIDSLSVMMAFIIGVIGSGICVYAVGYMRDFQAHEPEGAKDRRPVFFALMFLFLGAMYLFVFSNNMSWMFTGWEITTACSFLLIGYTRTEEAIRNAFRQVIMNLLGGIGFLVALYVSALGLGTLDFAEFLEAAVASPSAAVVAVTALAFAGLTKAAQMPFHTWLLGAMVAPTPTSALLHSSTMVKAGVFMLVKLAPAFVVSPIPSVMVVLVGACTFLLCSFMAISQNNAKRVLAYSTIANLGLIAACAGVGTPEAIWAAMFLILFHACAKSLLFLCVGTAEHHIGSRDIEEMDLLFERMPRLARYMMAGIMCMFVAPFGMLIAKWATLVSFVDSGQVILIFLLAFGSAATFMFWAKWLGKLSGIACGQDNIESTVHGSEWFAQTLMVVLVVVFCVTIPLVSEVIVEPYILSAYSVLGGAGAYAVAAYDTGISTDNLWITCVCSAIVFIVLFAGLGKAGKRSANVYLAGVTVDAQSRTFRNSLSGETKATSRNWYLTGLFGEARLNGFSTALNTVIILIGIIAAIARAVGLF